MNIIKFSAQWCHPCKIMKPIFEEVSKEEQNKNFNFVEVDIEGEDIIKPFDITPNDLCEKFKIRNIPTIVITDDNLNELNRFTGGMDKNKLMEFIHTTTLSKKGD